MNDLKFYWKSLCSVAPENSAVRRHGILWHWTPNNQLCFLHWFVYVASVLFFFFNMLQVNCILNVTSLRIRIDLRSTAAGSVVSGNVCWLMPQLSNIATGKSLLNIFYKIQTKSGKSFDDQTAQNSNSFFLIS